MGCMKQMVRGCTPTLKFTYPNINVDTIVVAYLTIAQTDLVIEKSLAEATKEEKALVWRLSQEDTLKLSEYESVKIQVRYKLTNGDAGASEEYRVPVRDILKDGVI